MFPLLIRASRLAHLVPTNHYAYVLLEGFRDTDNLNTDLFLKQLVHLKTTNVMSLKHRYLDNSLKVSNCGQLFLPFSICHLCIYKGMCMSNKKCTCDQWRAQNQNLSMFQPGISLGAVFAYLCVMFV